jgi:hypothetical protein
MMCDVLADTSTGLTRTEIGRLLKNLSVADPPHGMTKRPRLYEALRQRPERDPCGNLIETLRELGGLAGGMQYPAVTMTIRRLAKRLETAEALAKKVKRVERMLFVKA